MNLPLLALPPATTSILLVDDDVESRTEVAARLRDEGFRVVELSDGRELSERLLDQTGSADTPQVVIAAMFLPGVSGLEVCANAKDSGLPVAIILTTSLASDELLEEARHAGAHAVLEVPLDPARLREVVAQAIISDHD